jgi:hypothetical protein
MFLLAISGPCACGYVDTRSLDSFCPSKFIYMKEQSGVLSKALLILVNLDSIPVVRKKE